MFHGSDYTAKLQILKDAAESAINEAHRADNVTPALCIESPTPEEINAAIDTMTAVLDDLVQHLQNGKPCDPE